MVQTRVPVECCFLMFFRWLLDLQEVPKSRPEPPKAIQEALAGRPRAAQNRPEQSKSCPGIANSCELPSKSRSRAVGVALGTLLGFLQDLLRGLRTRKILVFLWKTTLFAKTCLRYFGALDGSLDAVLAYLGSILNPIWPPKVSKSHPRTAQKSPKNLKNVERCPKDALELPKRYSELPRTCSEVAQSYLKLPRTAREAFERCQELAKRCPRAAQEPPRAAKSCPRVAQDLLGSPWEPSCASRCLLWRFQDLKIHEGKVNLTSHANQPSQPTQLASQANLPRTVQEPPERCQELAKSCPRAQSANPTNQPAQQTSQANKPSKPAQPTNQSKQPGQPAKPTSQAGEPSQAVKPTSQANQPSSPTKPTSQVNQQSQSLCLRCRLRDNQLPKRHPKVGQEQPRPPGNPARVSQKLQTLQKACQNAQNRQEPFLSCPRVAKG
jgi:hypothetical protein